MDALFELRKAYARRKEQIAERLFDFRKFKDATEEEIFQELCFCLLTPGAKAENCAGIIAELKKKKLLLKGRRKDLRPFLKKARFYDQKALRLVSARKLFFKADGVRIKEKVFRDDPFGVRDWLIEYVHGLGYKEASHFLRNIGLGEDMAILDRHILRRLESCSVIKELPKSLTRNKYLEIEEKMRRFSQRLKIPLSHLDLLFFSIATGKPIKGCK